MFRPLFRGLENILVIGCHPDDIEIGCGGTLLRLLSEHSVHVHWAVLSGSGARAAEAQTSAECFLQRAGSSRVTLGTFRDAFFPSEFTEIKEYFFQLRDECRPDLIFTHRREDMHQDHRLVAELTWNTFRDHLILEYEIPKYEGDLGQPNVYVSLDELQFATKVRTIIESFPSQHDKTWFTEDNFGSMMRIRGAEADPATKFAEAFHCQKMVV